MRRDVISLIEAAYQVEQKREEWLQGVLNSAEPWLERGRGCSAFFYDASDVNRLRLDCFTSNTDRDAIAIMRAIEKSSPDRVQWVFRTQACRTASEGPDWENQPARKLFATWGIADVLFINGLDPSGRGCFLTAKLPELGGIPAAMKRRWSRLATHLGAGHRLIKRLTGDPSAVLTPGGRVEHADQEAAANQARSALREAVLLIERARGKLRRVDPDAAVQSWKGLVSAKWSLLDHFDTDGKRYVIARENSTTTPAPPVLSPRERQAVAYARMGHSNKLIAYELGVSASTVGVLLHRAAQKLGAKSREELFEAFARDAAPSAGDGSAE